MPSGYNALAARPQNRLAYPGGLAKRGASLDTFVPLDYSVLARGQYRQDTPQMREYAANVPIDVLRGRLAATLGLPSDIANTVRSPMPMEMFGQVDYGPQAQVPYGTEQLLKTLPLAPAADNPLGQVANQAGAAVPLTPMEALQAARLARQAALSTGRYVAPKVGQLAEDYMRSMGTMPSVVPPSGRSGIGGGVPRNAAALKAAVGNEPDIVRSLLGVKEYKDTGVIPQSAIDEALMTRQRMKAEPATTPGRKGSTDEWKQWGEQHGVNMTLTEPQSLGITDLTTKREIKIPGGLEGKFTIPDMFWMKANNIDPAALPKKTHDALMQKLIRTHEVENPDQVDVFNRLNFALLSPNAPLTPNEFLAQRMRLTNMDELQALAGRVGEPGLSRTAQEQTGVQAAARGGMGVLGTADLKNQAMLAKLVLDKPEMFQMAPGETMRDVTMRVMNQVPGLGPKTASLGTPWLNLIAKKIWYAACQ